MADEWRYRVADLHIDPVTGRVSRDGVDVPLAKLSYELLLVLIQAAPKLLSLDELASRVWKGVIVSPETVSQRVKLLRDALGDDAKAPRYIAGLRGRGYQLIAPVERLPSASHQEPARTVPTPSVAETVSATTCAAAITESSPRPRAPSEFAAAPVPTVPMHGWRSIRRPVLIAAFLLAVVSATLVFMLTTLRTPSIAAEDAAGFVQPHSVAVLAFTNLTGDPKQDYFVEGMFQEVVNSLMRINELHVRAGPSLSSLKGARTAASIARELKSATVLEGSVRRSENHVRITVQLIDAKTDDQLWSQIYDRELKDVLDLQSEIAERVATTLNVTLLGDVKHFLTVGGTTNPNAFEAYLRARHGESSQDRAGLRSGLDALDEAISLDPKYANAYAFRADLNLQLASEWAESHEEFEQLMQAAKEAGEKAVSLAPASATAHLELAMVLANSGINFRAIDVQFRKAAQLEPGNGVVQVRYAEWAALFGRPDALQAMQRAMGRNPTRTNDRNNLGVVLFDLRRHAEARPLLLDAAEHSHNPVIRNWAGMNELALKQPAEALKYCQDKTFSYDQICMAIALHQLNRLKEAQDILEIKMKAQGDGAAYQYAEIYASWGDRERAFEWLDKAVAVKDGGLSAILCDPFLDPLRGEPRFQELVTKLDLPT